MKTKQLFLGLTILSIFSIIYSCQKTNRNNAAEVVQQNNLGDITFLDFAYMEEQVSKGPSYFTTFNGDCSTLNYDTTGTTVTATIDYGAELCSCKDGKLRQGKITIVYPVNYTVIGSEFVTIPTGYSVNGNLIVGSHTAKVISNKLTKEISIATITPNSEIGEIQYNATRTREFIENTNSPNVIAGRNYKITGTTTGVTARGDDFTIEVTEPLEVQAGCRSIKGGVITVTSPNFKGEATVDYGAGVCDNKATLVYKKKEVELNL